MLVIIPLNMKTWWKPNYKNYSRLKLNHDSSLCSVAGAFRKIDKGRLACAVIKGKIKYAKKRYVCDTPVELKRRFPVAS